MTKQTKILTGLLAGVAVGTAIALILSSDKNDELKQKASDWFCDLLDSSKDKLAAVTGLIKEKAAKANV
jgi:gas vesicle protein